MFVNILGRQWPLSCRLAPEAERGNARESPHLHDRRCIHQIGHPYQAQSDHCTHWNGTPEEEYNQLQDTSCVLWGHSMLESIHAEIGVHEWFACVCFFHLSDFRRTQCRATQGGRVSEVQDLVTPTAAKCCRSYACTHLSSSTPNNPTLQSADKSLVCNVRLSALRRRPKRCIQSIVRVQTASATVSSDTYEYESPCAMRLQ
jgi:hypothetical protein